MDNENRGFTPPATRLGRSAAEEANRRGRVFAAKRRGRVAVGVSPRRRRRSRTMSPGGAAANTANTMIWMDVAA